MDKVKAAIIGAGRIGYWLDVTDSIRAKPASHYGAYGANPDVEIVGIADNDPSFAEAAVHPFTQGKAYADYTKMLYDQKPEIVSICTPDTTHAEIVRETIRYEGVKLIFCEKPIAPTILEAQDMIRRCKEFGVKLAVNHTRRWSPTWQYAKAEIDRGKIGKILKSVGYYSYSRKASDPARRDLDTGVHMADLMNWFGLKDVCLIGLDSKYLLFELEIFGENGRISCEENGRLLKLSKPEPSQFYESIDELSYVDLWGGLETNPTPMALAIKDLVECVRTDKQPECTGEDGLRALQIILGEK